MSLYIALLRRYFPKGYDFSTITPQQLQKAVDLINHRPRKLLNYLTAAEIFWAKKSGALGT